MIFRKGKNKHLDDTLKYWLMLLLCLFFTLSSLAQNSPTTKEPERQHTKSADSLINKVLSFPDRLFKKIDSRINHFDRHVTRSTDKSLRRIIKQEEKLKSLMAKGDSATTHNLFTRGIDSLKHFQKVITSKENKLSNSTSPKGEYFPYLDTLKTSLSFLNETKALSLSSPKTPVQITDALARVKGVEAKLQYSEKIKSYLRERQQILRQQLEHLSGYDKMKKEMAGISKEMYYYNQQLTSYKEMLSDPASIEQAATKLLLKVPAFNQFMEENGILSAMFTPKDATNLSRLQTREMVDKLMKDQMGLMGPDANKILEEKMSEAQGEIDKLKQEAAGEGDAVMPGFKPNGQKTKSLWQRLEIGTDCKFDKRNSLLPSTGDFGLSISYKLMKKGVIGIGGSWKVGLGKDITHMKLTHEGVSMRSFVEYAIIKGFNIRGGWEKTFLLQKVSTENLILLKNPKNWQQSALIGISKRMSVPLKVPVLKKKAASGNVQLLYDFLHESHVPASPALQVRVGMGL